MSTKASLLGFEGADFSCEYSHYLYADMLTSHDYGRSMEDLDAFQRTVPQYPDHMVPTQESVALSFASRLSRTPLRVSEACRLVHSCLTGPKARHRPQINDGPLRRAWDILHQAWGDLDILRQNTSGGIVQPEDMDVFAHGWQVSGVVWFLIAVALY